MSLFFNVKAVRIWSAVGLLAHATWDVYPILPPDGMPRVHVRIVESGAPMGGIGEPGLPACRQR